MLGEEESLMLAMGGRESRVRAWNIETEEGDIRNNRIYWESSTRGTWCGEGRQDTRARLSQPDTRQWDWGEH